ncbi:ketopantoate reductase family protein [Occultella glacieicola]|uniref:Ketopantoate reductase family protein n=1 Tax=Occultella glacieicola TaxID=2518684 RepID=A0ABY2E901_9MICO|nr:2-dehydropantoate 2-reductase N-terminal domain-containing protein [Occultella glacieicola]TDE97463.1 ketopantoate reductase family protein [Occultella glacieicola]
MRYVMIGAGAVGGTIGGRLAGAGREVALVARGAHARALVADGLRLETPDGTHTHRLPVVTTPAELGELRADDVLVLAVKTQDSAAALVDWAQRPVRGGGTAAARLPVLCAQNGVENERLALRAFRRVYGVCVWLPASHLQPGLVSAPAAPLSGVLHLGAYPGGVDPLAHAVSADLEDAWFESPVVADVMRWKYAKLLANLGNAIEALTGPVQSEAAHEVLALARAEGSAVLAAAGIPVVPEAEQTAVRGDKMRLQAMASGARGGGSSWQSLRRGTGTIEADYLNGEIVLLGRLHGVPTPANAALQRLAGAAARDRRPPAAMTVAELVAALGA